MAQLNFSANNRLFAPQLNNIAYSDRRAVDSGALVTESVIPAMTVDVSAGTLTFDGATVTVLATPNIVIAAADPSDDRIDLVLVDSLGALTIATGTPAITPLAPVYDPEVYYVLAMITVPDGATAIFNADITDTRMINFGLGGGGGGLASYTEAVSGSNTYVITHNLSDSNPVVQFYEDITFELIEPQTVTVLTANSIQVDFAVSTDGTAVVHGGSFSPLSSINGSMFIETMFPDTVTGPTQGIVGYNPSLDFPDASANFAYNSFELPQDLSLSNDMYFVFYYVQDGTSTNTFRIKLDVKITDIGFLLTAADVLNLVSTPTPAGVVNELQSVEFTIPNGNLSALSELISFKVTRDGSVDTNPDTFQIVNIQVKYTRGA